MRADLNLHRCKFCKDSQICEHDREKSACDECRKKINCKFMCEHGNRRIECCFCGNNIFFNL